MPGASGPAILARSGFTSRPNLASTPPRAIGKASEARELLLTALLLADELDEARGAAAKGRIEEAQRVAAMERCAETLEALAVRLEKPAQSA